MTTPRCDRCGLQQVIADVAMVRWMLGRLSLRSPPWDARLRSAIAMVCPACDAYALGVETSDPVPFYSEDVAAFLTTQDFDWWNQDPAQCDIRRWPDFGCLTFSEIALRSTVANLRQVRLDQASMLGLDPPPSSFVAAAGIPMDMMERGEWSNQLRVLHSRMGAEFPERELDHAVRRLIALLCLRDESEPVGSSAD